MNGEKTIIKQQKTVVSHNSLYFLKEMHVVFRQEILQEQLYIPISYPKITKFLNVWNWSLGEITNFFLWTWQVHH